MPSVPTSKFPRLPAVGLVAGIFAIAILVACTETVVIGEGLGETSPVVPSSEGKSEPKAEPSNDGAAVMCGTPGMPPPPSNDCGSYKGMPLYACNIPGTRLLGADEHGLYAYRYPVAATDDPTHTIYRLEPDNTSKILSTFTRPALGAETVVFVQGELFVLDRGASSIEALRPGAGGAIERRTVRLELPGYKVDSVHVLDCRRIVASMQRADELTLGGGLYLFDEGAGGANPPRPILKTLNRPMAIGKEHVYYAKLQEGDRTHVYRTPLAGGAEEHVYTPPPDADETGLLSVFVANDDIYVVQRVLAAVATTLPRPKIRLIRQPVGGAQTSIEIGTESALGGITAARDAIYYVYGSAIYGDATNIDPRPDDPSLYRNTLFRVPFDLHEAVGVVEYGTLPPRSGFETIAANMGPVIAGDRIYFGAWDRVDHLKTGKTGRILSHTLRE